MPREDSYCIKTRQEQDARDTTDVAQRGLARNASSKQLCKEKGGTQCGHLENSIWSQRDWPTGASAMRWDSACSV